MSWFPRFRRRKQSSATLSPPVTAPTLADAPDAPPNPSTSPPVPAREEASTSAESAPVEEIQLSIPLLINWLNAPNFREKRVYLLNHTELLKPEWDHLFTVLYQQYAADPNAVMS